MAFKGGNALRFIYGNRRSTRDLDFTRIGGVDDRPDAVRKFFDLTLAGVEGRSGLRAFCQRVRRRPPGAGKTRPTYLVSVGYQFPGDRLFGNVPGVSHVPTAVPVEVSFNEVVCETVTARDRGVDLGRLTVCSLDDIVAEKLRALLQQVVRNRRREQDVYDIAAVLADPAGFGAVDPASVAQFLVEKCRGRDVTAARSAFRNPEVRDRAAADYDRTIREQAGEAFVPFAEAWSRVSGFVGTLPLPE